MAGGSQSLKNLDSFSRGYIEKVRSKIDFGTSKRGTLVTGVTASKVLVFADIPGEISNTITSNASDDAFVSPGMNVSGIGITGVPKVVQVSADGLTITLDQEQTLVDNTILTFSDTNFGLSQYDLSGSTKRRSKEDIRIQDLIPSELFSYATSSAYGSTTNDGGINSFLKAYYQFLNLEEFLYKEEETFEDTVIDNVATFRILDPDLKNNHFFVKDLVSSAKFFDENDNPLTVGEANLPPRPSGTNITLNDTAVLTVGTTYIITNLGSESAGNVKTDLDLLIEEDEQQASYAVNDTFVAIDDGTALSNANDIVVQELISPESDVDIKVSNIIVSNGSNLPGLLSGQANTGKTVTIRDLPGELNRKKLKMTGYCQYYVNANPSYRLNTIEDSLNINENEEEFLDMMQREIAPAINKSLNVNKRALYQRLIDFYKVRGSRDSIDTFFKLFFGDEEIEVEYPIEKTLKPSEGNFDSASQKAANFSPAATLSGEATAGDLFGGSVDVSGDTVIVGARYEDTGGSNRGKVYIHTTSDSGATWSLQKGFQAQTPGNSNQFGAIVKIDGDTVAIAAPGNGKLEIWERFVNSSGNLDWAFNTELEKPAGTVDESGGNSVNYARQLELANGYLAVGAPRAANTGTCAGALYIYKQVGSTWTLNQTIQADVSMFSANPDGSKCRASGINGAGFGAHYAGPEHVKMHNDYLVLGFPAYGDVNERSGATIVYKRDSAGQYQQEAFITPPQVGTGVQFGIGIDITTDSSGQDIIAIGQLNSSGIAAKVFIYGRSVSFSGTNKIPTWELITTIRPPTNQGNRRQNIFGMFVALNKDDLIVSDPGLFTTKDAAGVTIAGFKGLVHQYKRTEGSWGLQPVVTNESSSGYVNDHFGFSLAISKDDKDYIIAGRRGSTNASFTPVDSGKAEIFRKPVIAGKYLDNKGFLSDTQKLHDSDRYQKYSYVVKAPRNIAQWEDIYNKLVHPAGFKYFGEILIITKMVRDFLGDNTKGVTIPGYVDPLNAYASSPAFRKTLSSMPGIQPGYIGIEDLGLIIESLGSLFGPIGIAKANRSAKLSITQVAANGAIEKISIANRGSGYNSAPTITIAGAGSSGTATCTINSRGEINSITITNAGTGYNLASTATPQTLAQVSSSGTETQIGKDSSTTLGLFFSSFANRKFRTLPTIVIGEPDARDATNTKLATNVQATATFTHSSISGGSFEVGKEYKITSAGDTDWLSIGAPNKAVGTIFRATGAGSGSGTATDFRITGFTVTEAGNGYINDPKVEIQSNPTREKRVPQYEHKKIVPSNHIDGSINLNVATHMTRVNIANNYYNRKNYSQNVFFNSTKKFNGNFQLKDFSDIEIQNMDLELTNDGTNINKLNNQSFIDIE